MTIFSILIAIWLGLIGPAAAQMLNPSFTFAKKHVGGGPSAYISAVSALLPVPNGSTAVDTTIPNGSSAVITWDSAGAGSCSGSGPGFSTGGAVSGTATVSPTTGTNTYSVNCGGQIATAHVTVSGNLIDAAATYCAANGGGTGSSVSPWRYNCINAAVAAASAGDTILLAGGNWRLDTADTTFVSINKALALVGVGSGNTVDSYGHINNASGTTMCPTAGTSITCVYQTGTSYCFGNPGSGNSQCGPPAGGVPTAPPFQAGTVMFGVNGANAPNCVNETVAHIFFDGSTTSDGGDFLGTLAFVNCSNGPITVSDIRLLTFGNTAITGETQFTIISGSNVLVQNSMMGNPLFSGSYHSGQAFESVADNGETVQNNVFWQGVYNPTSNSSILFTGNVSDMTQGSFYPAFGPTGCALDPGNIGGAQCGLTNGLQGLFHTTFANNYQNGGGQNFAIGLGVNDIPSNGVVSDIHYTGNWVVGATAEIGACVWDLVGSPNNCTNLGMASNAQADSSCVLSSNGNIFSIANNSLIGTAGAALRATVDGSMKCYDAANPGGVNVNLQIFGFDAEKNYLSSPSNQYATIPTAVSPIQTGNFCASSAGTVTGCATSGFTTPPTVSFTLGTLWWNGVANVVNFASTGFTAQYGAVQWLASTSSTTPTSGGQAGGSSWSYTPPIYLSGVTHGSTVYMWTMDSANHISARASAPIP